MRQSTSVSMSIISMSMRMGIKRWGWIVPVLLFVSATLANSSIPLVNLDLEITCIGAQKGREGQRREHDVC